MKTAEILKNAKRDLLFNNILKAKLFLIFLTFVNIFGGVFEL